jgi:Alkylmercury lyase
MNTTDPDRQSRPDSHDDPPVRIELLSAPECLNTSATRQVLVDCLAELDLNTPLVEHIGRYRSPTVLVNGIDVMSPASSDRVDGDACRLDLPSRDRVLAAINAILSRSDRPLTLDSLRDAANDGTAARAAALPESERELHRRVLRAFLITGRAPDRAEVQSFADSTGVSLADGLRRLAELDLVHCAADGRILVAYPFSGEPTGHSVRLPDMPAVEAMCAIDALGIPLMTDLDGVITSTDPATRQVIRVRRRGERWLWEPATTVVLLAQTADCGTAAKCLCPSITFHIDRDHAHHYLRQHPELRGSVLGQQEAVEIARRSFGSLLTT